MDILENGRDSEASRRLLRGWPGRLLVGAVIIAILAVIGVHQLRGHNKKPGASARVPVMTSSVVPALVEVGSKISWVATESTKDFVVQFDLKNYNSGPARVQANEAGPAHPGFTTLAIAVLPANPRGDELDYGQVATAMSKPMTLGGNQTAILAIAGRVACGTSMITDNSVDLVVNGVQETVTLPRSDHGDWAAIARGTC